MKKMRTLKSKILSGVLALCMVVLMLPMASTTAHAAPTDRAMMMGMGGIQNVNTNDVANSDQIVMGTHGGSPVHWVMLGDSPTDITAQSYIAAGSTGKMMFAVNSLGTSAFESDGDGYYPNSTLNGVMTSLYSSSLGLSPTEQGAVLDTSLTAVSMGDGSTFIPAGTINDLTGQRFFPLSTGEFNSLVVAGAQLSQDSSATYWRLRFSGSNKNSYAVGGSGGSASGVDVSYDNGGVRPAFNLNTASVLFTSAAVGGKAGAVANAPSVLSGTAPTRWKMTLSDASRSAFTIVTTAVSGNEYTVAYSGATTGTNEYISAMIVDGGGNITHYGKIQALPNPTDANGTFTIDMAIPAGSTLKIFNEQANGDNSTDYSSPLRDMSTTINAPSVTNTLTNITTDNSSTYISMPVSGDYTATLTADAGYVLPQTITVSVGGTLLTSGYTYVQSTGELTIPQTSLTGDIEITAQALSTATDITGFVVAAQVGASVIDTSRHTVALTMPYGTNVTNLAPTITLSDGATVSPTTAQDFTGNVTYTVTAQDGTTTQDWTVTVSIEPPSTATDITGFVVAAQVGASVIDTSRHTVVFTMPYDTDVTALAPSITLSGGASISPTTAQDFSNAVTYEVTAQDGTTKQNWTVSVTFGDAPLSPTAPTMTGGTGQIITQGQSASFTSSADFDRYTQTLITLSGGAPYTVHTAGADNVNASAVNGSITVTLSGTYTATLPLGTHSISINSEQGNATASFTVVAATPAPTTALSPQTGVYCG